MKRLSIALLATFAFAGAALAEDKGGSSGSPGHQMQNEGSKPGSPGASGHAPGHEKTGTSGASEAPGQNKK